MRPAGSEGMTKQNSSRRSDRTRVGVRGRRAPRRSHVSHPEQRHWIVTTTIIALIFAHDGVA